MSKETNNEIDLLLRRLSRRQEVPVSDAETDHLDADELSVFAENALPAAARARYTEHLADCSKCREIVAQLSASVPVVARETVTAAAPSGLRNFLASLFSPMVLRYAVPALGLIVVAAIGFVVLQSSGRRASDVAQLAPKPQSPAPNASTEQPDSKVFNDSNDAAKESSPTIATRPSTGKTIAEAAQEPPPPAPKPAAEVAAPTTAAPVQKNEQQAAVANAPAAPPQASPAPAATVDDMRVDVQGRRNEPVQGRELAKQKTAQAQGQDKSVASVQSANRRGAAPATAGAGARRDGTDSTFRVAEEEEKDRADGVVRNVAGRRFRKQGGVWVDTAYSSGSAIVNLARGSEAYRALVADEPEIKKFADELDGPFVVVWKGRTYRIR
jgi:hypothetical protein